jgi:translation initiation factor 2B subunit (eIF-2B alpha/beta/delta family)
MILKEQISKTFLDVEAELGTTGLCKIVLESFIESLDNFKCTKVDDFMEQFKELALIIKNTKPRMGIVIYYICEIWDQIEENRSKFKTVDDLKLFLSKISKKLIGEIKQDSDKVKDLGANYIEDGDSILIHSHSKTVLDIIQKAKKQRIKFKVVVAEQEAEKTMDIIKFLRKTDIDFVVVPEFMLSHIEDQVSKVFLGGLTFNDKYYFVTDAGTNSLVAEFHGIHIPIYIFLTTTKFSLWNSSEEHSTHKVKQVKTCKSLKDILCYDRIKFSHDRINIDSLDFMVTEEGTFTPKEAKALFDKKLKERKKWQEKHFND